MPDFWSAERKADEGCPFRREAPPAVQLPGTLHSAARLEAPGAAEEPSNQPVEPRPWRPQFGLFSLLAGITLLCLVLAIPGMGQLLLGLVAGPAVVLLGLGLLILLQSPLMWLWLLLRRPSDDA